MFYSVCHILNTKKNSHTHPIHRITFHLQRLWVTKVSRIKWGNLEGNMSIRPGQFKELKEKIFSMGLIAKAANGETFLNECDNCATCVISAKNNVISSCCQKGRGGAGSGLQMTTRPLNPFCAKRFCPPTPSTLGTLTPCPASGWLCSTQAIAWHSFCSRICLRFQLVLTRCEIPI